MRNLPYDSQRQKEMDRQKAKQTLQQEEIEMRERTADSPELLQARKDGNFNNGGMMGPKGSTNQLQQPITSSMQHQSSSSGIQNTFKTNFYSNQSKYQSQLSFFGAGKAPTPPINDNRRNKDMSGFEQLSESDSQVSSSDNSSEVDDYNRGFLGDEEQQQSEASSQEEEEDQEKQNYDQVAGSESNISDPKSAPNFAASIKTSYSNKKNSQTSQITSKTEIMTQQSSQTANYRQRQTASEYSSKEQALLNKHRATIEKQDAKTGLMSKKRKKARFQKKNVEEFKGQGNQFVNSYNQRGSNIEQLNIKRSIELSQGQALRSLNNFHKNSNAISLHCYKGFFGLMWFFWDIVIHIDHLILLTNLLLEFVAGSTSLSDFSHIIATISISLLVTGYINYLADQKLKDAADAVNNKPIERFIFGKKSGKFMVSDWSKVQCGDFLKIKANQEFPCDSLILDIVGSKSVTQTCYTRGGLFDDDGNPSLKRSYQGTMNRTGSHISDQKFVTQLSGLLKWEYNHSGYFFGSFKQADSPGAFDITPENIVQRGCYMQNAQYAICLALNVGYSSMGNQQQEMAGFTDSTWKKFIHRSQRQNHFESVHFSALRYVQLISIVFCLFPCTMIVLQNLILKDLTSTKFVEAFSDSAFTYSIESYALILSGFLQNFPYLAKLTMDAVIFFHAYFTMWDINLVPAQLNYNDLKIMKSMGQIDSIVCPKSAFLWGGTSYTAAFKINERIFINLNEKNQRIQEEEAIKDADYNLSDSGLDENSDKGATLEYLPNSIDFDPSFHSSSARELLLQEGSPDREKFRQLLLATAICHHASSNRNKGEKGFDQAATRQTYKSMFKDEEAQLHFAHSFDHKFLYRKGKMVVVMVDGVQKRFKEIIKRRILTKEKDPITISVIQPFESYNQGLTIYFRAPLRCLRDYLNEEEFLQCSEDIKYMQEQGNHAYGIAKHEISEKNAPALIRAINENQMLSKSHKNKNDKLLLHMLLKQVKIVGIFGIQVAYNYRDTLVIEDLRKNGIKLYMLSGEDVDDVHTDCNAMNLLEGFSEPIQIEGRTEREVEESLENGLKEVLKRRQLLNDQLLGKGNDKGNKNDYINRNTVKKKKRDGRRRRKEERKEGGLGVGQILPIKNENQQNKNNQENLKTQQASSMDKVKETNAVFFNGHHLEYILKDQTLEKLFLSLCNMCSICIGSSVSPFQRKYVVKAIRQFAVQGKLGNVISIISKQSDKFTIEEADITVGLIYNYKQSDVLARTDVQMKNLYGLTYLFFRHGTLAHRRAKVVLTEFIYRTVITQIIAIFAFFVSGFSYTLPYGRFFFSFFMAVQTPIQFWIEGISHSDYGYPVFHRIFGEYRFNLVQQVSFKDFFEVLSLSLIDALAFCLIYLMAGILWDDQPVEVYTGRDASSQAYLILNSILLSIININRIANVKSNIMVFLASNYLFFIFSLITILEDEFLLGFRTLISAPHLTLSILFLFLLVSLKTFIRLVRDIVLPWNRKIEMRYQYIEDRIFMEEYEDPEMQFSIANLESFSVLAKTLEANSVFAINQNLLIVHRSDSMDEILERLNLSSQQITDDQSSSQNINVSAFINRYNLKLHDINKEIEYTQNVESIRHVESAVPTLWLAFYFYLSIFLLKIFNSTLFTYLGRNKARVDSSTTGITIESSYFELLIICLICFVIFTTKRIRYQKSRYLVFTLIVLLDSITLVQFYQDLYSPLSQIQFLFTIAFTFGARLNFFFQVTSLGIVYTIATLQLRLSVIQDKIQNDFTQSAFQLTWMTLSLFCYVLVWIYYSYWEDLNRKVQFVVQYRKIKEYQKQLSIVGILIPALVRNKVSDGKKNQTQVQKNATIIYICIDEFDRLMSNYQGRELLDILDKFYNGMDNFAESYGLSKIEIIGRICIYSAGMRIYEREIDPRLMTSPPTLRALEFANKAHQYINQITLKDGSQAGATIGICTGEIIAGIVGEVKPQYNVVGPAMSLAKELAVAAPSGILVSQSTHRILSEQISNFLFTEQTLISRQGKEIVGFVIQKRKNILQKNLYNRGGAGGGRNRLEYSNNQANKVGGQTTHNKPSHLLGQSKDGGSRPLNKDKISENTKNRLARGEDPNNFDHKTMGANTNRTDAMTERNFMSQRSNANLVTDRNNLLNDTFEEDKIEDGDESQDDDQLNQLNIKSIKGDKMIVANVTLNDRYKLVERPKWLFNFENPHLEDKFKSYELQRHRKAELCNVFSMLIYDLLLIQVAIFAMTKGDYIQMILGGLVSIGLSVLHIFIMFFKRNAEGSYYAFMLQSLITIAIIIYLGPVFKSMFLRELTETNYTIYLMLVFQSHVFQFRTFLIFSSIITLLFMVNRIMQIRIGEINIYTFLIDVIVNLFYLIFLQSIHYNREMKARRQYNNERIVDVEIERTEEQLNRLVPEHALKGIRNDQRVVDQFENMTLLYADIHGFSSAMQMINKPEEVVAFMNRLFVKFDSLCEQYNVYKVHSHGDTYVVMGYKGKENKGRRSENEMVIEAYNVLQVGVQMVECVQEELQRLKDPILRRLDINVGIHSGTIIGGILGTKLVRYDIFGKDVYLTRFLEQNSVKGQVVVSESTQNLIKKKAFIYDTFDWQEREQLYCKNLKCTLNSFVVEQIFAQNESSLDDNIVQGGGPGPQLEKKEEMPF